jgi:uncharacterized protein (DUF697 family)
MAIIYSYPRVTSLNSSDLLIATRFENEDNGSARTISFTADAIGSYVLSTYNLNYGLASQIANSVAIANTTVATSLIGQVDGTLTFPANGLNVGDSFDASFVGHINNNNGVTLLITIETATGVVLGSTGAMNLGLATNKKWLFNINFVVRAIGAAGTAKMLTTGTFSHNKDANFNPDGFTFVTENSTTFDTTVTNELVIKATWGVASTSNSIYSQVFTLSKVY